jgi:hypothetical protein
MKLIACRTASIVAWIAAWLATGCLAACGLAQPAQGTSLAEVLRSKGPPTGRYGLPGGGARLEYASGPYGRTTWMIDVDTESRVIGAQQALSEPHFAELQSHPGWMRQSLLLEIGRPGERHGGGLAGGEVWSWRYPTNDCLWFQASVADDGRVSGLGYGIDPRCDAGANDHD